MEKPDTTSKPAPDAAHREAFQYWGYLIKKDKCGTDIFDRLLKGIANVISTKFHPHDSPDLTPAQLAAFYRAVGGDYDVLFIDTPPSSISFIYRSLGAFHSLQPAPDDDGYSVPTIPALKAKGFVTWQTIQLLLGPEQHVPFLQKAVEVFDIKDPETGNVFPKILPNECFPDRPDDAMEQWYESVAERLKREAEKEAAEKDTARVRVEVDEPGPRSSSEVDDDRHGAASYFADPLYRNARTRPGYFRHFSKQSAYGEERGGMVGRVRHVLNMNNPFHKEGRMKNSPTKYPDAEYLDVDATPTATVPPAHPGVQHHRYPAANHKRPHPPRREGSLSTTDSDSDSGRPAPRSRQRSPVLRHRRSHEPPTSPREYFPAYYDERERRYSHSHDTTPEIRRKSPEPPRKSPERPPPPVYGPTQTPIFATHVAKMQAQNYVYDRRPAPVPGRTSYRPNNVRYTVSPADPDPAYLRERKAAEPDSAYMRDRKSTENDSAYLRDRKSSEAGSPYLRERDRDRERERERDRDYDSPSTSSRHRERPRRRSDEYPHERERDRERSNSARTTRSSHDRVKDEWDDRDLSRDRDRDRERDRDRDGRVRARYVSSSGGVQDGVGGRRYAVGEQPWR